MDLIIEKRKKYDWNKGGKVIIEKLVRRYKIKEYDGKLLEHIDQYYNGEYRDNSHIISAAVTHNHPEGIKGAQATAACIFLARFSIAY